MRRGRRRLHLLPVLPTLLTAGNLACGVTAIFCAASSHGLLLIGSVLIFAAMLCDMLDGKVARMTGTTGEFGAELDSLADVISFGVAPAMLVHRAVLGVHPGAIWGEGEQWIWLLAVFYAVMTAIRLARYNVEGQAEDEAPTTSFRGLPSPGAAALLCAWVLCYAWYNHDRYEATWLAAHLDYAAFDLLLRWWMAALLALCAFLMVSSIRFPHLGNTLLAGKITLRRLMLLLLGIGVVAMKPQWGLALLTSGYVLIGFGQGFPQVLARWRAGHDLMEEDDPDEPFADSSDHGD